METLSVSKFKATCLAVLEDVNRQKKGVIITKRGKPIAEIIPVSHQQKDVPLKETITFMGDIVSPVVEDEWETLK
ncbi:MAG: type II toxin-antitoxin system Phd/YefM family antitoxin [Desulfobacterales bacterium]|nr:type II toxin-antitoxin system Phd/YefM family antitoxin [Desulfobacterales bacterium]